MTTNTNCERTKDLVREWKMRLYDEITGEENEFDVDNNGGIIGDLGITFKENQLNYGLYVVKHTVSMKDSEEFNATTNIFAKVVGKSKSFSLRIPVQYRNTYF